MADNNVKTNEKKVFIAPELTVHGDVQVITQGQSSGNTLDRTFPTGFPVNQLTFS